MLNQPVGSNREFHFEYPEIRLRPDLDLKQFSGVVRVTRTLQGMLIQGRFSAQAAAECVRCLNEYEQELNTDFSELFAFKPEGVTDSDLLYPEDGNIDLEPLVREYLLLELPIQSLCRPDCKGLCQVCGADLNSGDCGHLKALHTEISADETGRSR